MNEIDSNRDAWGKLSEDHYRVYKERLETGLHAFNPHIQRELGDIAGKDVIHLQCNTGADTIALSKMGAKHVTGVDLVPDNIFYARKLASDLNVDNVDFVESDIMELVNVYHKKHDVVFTSEGVLGWLPDLGVWASAIRDLLKDDGFLYVFDSHPFFLAFDESRLAAEEYEIKYPYFGKTPDVDDGIGGYATERKDNVKAYFWMHPVSEIINAVTSAGMHVEYFNEFTENFFRSGGEDAVGDSGLFRYAYNKDKYPMSFSLKAVVYNG